MRYKNGKSNRDSVRVINDSLRDAQHHAVHATSARTTGEWAQFVTTVKRSDNRIDWAHAVRSSLTLYIELTACYQAAYVLSVHSGSAFCMQSSKRIVSTLDKRHETRRAKPWL
jgi:hypothetical protein